MALQVDQATKNAKYIINGWQDGIADSQELGFGIIRNTEIGMFPGQAIPGNRPLSWVKNLASKSYTVDSTTNIFTVSSANRPGQNVCIQFINSGGTLPAGIASGGTYNAGTAYTAGQTVEYNNTIYRCVYPGTGKTPDTNYDYWSVAYFYVQEIDATTFTISREPDGAAIDVTSNGTGTNTFSTAVMGTPKYGTTVKYVLTGYSTFYTATILQDDVGQIWYRDQNNSRNFYLIQGNARGSGTTVQGTGIALFYNLSGNVYLFACNKQYAQVFDLTAYYTSGTNTWSNNVTTRQFDSRDVGAIHTAIYGQDNRIYFCDGRYITAFSEVGTFDPTNAATYNFATKALTLPGNTITQCLEELGQNLVIGDKASNYLYQWDRTSTNFSIPIRCPEDGIYKLININNTVYVLAGKKGIVYSTQGYTCDIFRKLPEYVTGGQVVWGGIEKVNGHLIFGCVGNKADTATKQNGGVYKIFLHTLAPGTLVIDQTPATGSTDIEIPVLITYDADSYFFATYESSLGQVDYVTPQQSIPFVGGYAGRYTSYGATLESPLFSVSQFQEHRNMELTGIELGKKLLASEGVKVSYRENITDSYTDLTTFDYATYGDIVNEYAISSISEVQSIQLKISLTSGSSSNQSPRLKTVAIK